MKTTNTFTKKTAFIAVSALVLGSCASLQNAQTLYAAQTSTDGPIVIATASDASISDAASYDAPMVIATASDDSALDAASSDAPMVIAPSAAAKKVITAKKAKLNLAISVDGQKLKSKGFYVTYSDGTKIAMVPLSQTAAKLNLKVTKHGNKQYTLESEEMKVDFTRNEDSYFLTTTVEGRDGSSLFSTGQAAVLKNRRIYVPADIVSAVLGNYEGFVEAAEKKISFNTSVLPAKGDSAGDSAQIPNPVYEFASLEALQKQVGFQLNIPQGLGKLDITRYS